MFPLQAVGAERKRYGFVLERHCAMVKHQVNWHGKANTLLQIKLAEWLALCRAYQVRTTRGVGKLKHQGRPLRGVP